MSYTTIHQCANDVAFCSRLMACAAQEGSENPEYDVSAKLRWPVSAKTDIEAAYEYAVNAENPNPGGDPTVITDQQILSAVQSLITVEPAAPAGPSPESA